MQDHKRICLIDLSGIFRMHWHATENEDVGEAHKRTMRDAVAFAAGYDAVGIAIDCPPYRRKEICPEYKAQREKAPAMMVEQIRSVQDQLRADGYHVLGSDGYEADDIIATICEWAESQNHETTVYSADKDLLQLVSPKTSVISSATRQKYTPDDVVAKFGIHPELIPDFLALIGDKSDNIAGIKGCGPKTAAKWLQTYGDLAGVIANAAELGNFAERVSEAKDLLGKWWQLTRLATDVPIQPEEIMTPMERKETVAEPDVVIPEEMPQQVATAEKPQTALATIDYNRALEPQSSAQAWGLAQALFKSRMFGDFPNPESILAIVMTGRSLGMDAVASLRGFHFIKGKAAPSAQLLVGLVKRHPACEWFRLISSDEKQATWETKRRDEPEATTMSYTMQDAAAAQLTNLDQWKKRPKTMLRWRAGVELARAVFPDVVSGLYTIDELLDMA